MSLLMSAWSDEEVTTQFCSTRNNCLIWETLNRSSNVGTVRAPFGGLGVGLFAIPTVPSMLLAVTFHFRQQQREEGKQSSSPSLLRRL